MSRTLGVLIVLCISVVACANGSIIEELKDEIRKTEEQITGVEKENRETELQIGHVYTECAKKATLDEFNITTGNKILEQQYNTVFGLTKDIKSVQKEIEKSNIVIEEKQKNLKEMTLETALTGEDIKYLIHLRSIHYNTECLELIDRQLVTSNGLNSIAGNWMVKPIGSDEDIVRLAMKLKQIKGKLFQLVEKAKLLKAELKNVQAVCKTELESYQKMLDQISTDERTNANVIQQQEEKLKHYQEELKKLQQLEISLTTEMAKTSQNLKSWLDALKKYDEDVKCYGDLRLKFKHTNQRE